MSDEKAALRSSVAALAAGLLKLASTPPRIIASPKTQPRRAAVALIIRVVPPSGYRPNPPTSAQQPTLGEFLSYDWVNAPRAVPEILFLRRGKSASSLTAEPTGRANQDSNLSFPGGRTEDGDEGGLYTAMRHTWEEIGIDLAEKDYIYVGQLDDREITTSLGKRLLMILSPFVFLQVTPSASGPDPSEGTVLYWTPLSSLADTNAIWSSVTVDIASRLAPRNSTILRLFLRFLIGSMQFPSITLQPTASSNAPLTEELKLWGLTLGMTLDLLDCMGSAPSPELTRKRERFPRRASPSMTTVFPNFSHPDVNFWIWVFGKRYREVVRGWEQSMRSDGTNDRRINWMGTALNSFYASVRKALVMVIAIRAICVLAGGTLLAWWMVFRTE